MYHFATAARKQCSNHLFVPDMRYYHFTVIYNSTFNYVSEAKFSTKRQALLFTKFG